MRRALPLMALVASAVALVAAAGGSELYGRPLRGLTAVPIETVVKSPEQYRDKTIRVSGVAGGGSAHGVTLSEGGANLLVQAEGFSFPEGVDGARVTAEGKLRGGSAPTLAATGVEVRR